MSQDVRWDEEVPKTAESAGESEISESISRSGSRHWDKARSSKAFGNAMAAAGLRKSLVSQASMKMGGSSPTRGSMMMSGGAGQSDFLDSENLDSMLKSLVSTKKMDTVWQKFGRRVASLESVVEKLTGTTASDNDDEGFLTKKEFRRLSEARPTSSDSDALAAVERSTTEVARKMQEQTPVLDKLKSNLHKQEEASAKAMQEALDAAQKAEDFHLTLEQQLKEAARQTAVTIAEEHAQRTKLEGSMSDKIKEAWVSMKELEKRLQDFARAEARKATKELLFTESGPPMSPRGNSRASTASARGGGFAFGLASAPPTPNLAVAPPDAVKASPSSTVAPAAGAESPRVQAAREPSGQLTEADAADDMNGLREAAFAAAAKEGVSGLCYTTEQWRTGLLSVVEAGLIQPVREEMAQLRNDMGRQKEELERKLRSGDKERMELATKAARLTRELKEESDARKADGERSQETIQEVYKAIHRAEEKAKEQHDEALRDLEEVRHTVGLHTEKITGHTKDILNSATVNDAKKLSDLIQKSATKDIFKKEMSELKKVLDYHTDKIDTISMQVSVNSKAPGSPKGRRGGKSGNKRRQAGMKRDASATSEAASTAPGQGSLQSLVEKDSDDNSDGEEQEGGPIVADPEDQEGFVEDGEGEENPRPPRRSDATPGKPEKTQEPKAAEGEPGSEEEDEEEEDEDEWDEEDSDYSDSPGEVQLREQVQGTCMGLVCLAQHVLRGPPQVGLSRQNRLLNEKELLDELLKLREWVTHRHAPADWSLDRLTSVSLRYAHPNPMEVHGPQPEMAKVLQRHLEREVSPRQSFNSSPRAADRTASSISPREGGYGGRRYPLDATVGSIGLDGGYGSCPGGGAGILGGQFEDGSQLSPAQRFSVTLPVLERGKLATTPREKAVAHLSARGSKKAAGALKAPMTARESRGLAATLPPLSGLPGSSA